MTYITATILLEAKQAPNETLITSNWSCALKAAFSYGVLEHLYQAYSLGYLGAYW